MFVTGGSVVAFEKHRSSRQQQSSQQPQQHGASYNLSSTLEEAASLRLSLGTDVISPLSRSGFLQPSGASNGVRTPHRVRFASLGARLLEGIRQLSPNGQEASIRRTFNRIDQDGKGHITEADLTQYAESAGLPSTYVRPFVSAVLAQSSSSSSRGEGSLVEEEEPAEAELTYNAFSRFVKAREAGLRQAFSLFDSDGDGVISAADLELSLSQVAVCCPSTRRVYRMRAPVAQQLVAKMGVRGSRALAFPEFRNYFMLLPQRELLVEYWLADGACSDLGTRVTLQEEHRGTSAWGHLLAGAVAGATSRTVTAPLETLRLAAMAGTLPPGLDLPGAANHLMADRGWTALFRGNLVNVLRSAPQKAIDFYAFDVFKRWLGDGGPDAAPSAWRTFAAAGCAGASSWLLLYPLEVVRSRLTVDVAGRYRGSIAECWRSMLAQEGPRAFTRGLGPSIAAIFPEAAITYGLHDRLKRSYRRTTHQEPGLLPSLGFGVVSAWCGQLVAYPLETISRRMQLAAPAAAAASGAAVATTAPAATAAIGAAAATRLAAAAPTVVAVAAPAAAGSLAAAAVPLAAVGVGSSAAAAAAATAAGASVALPYAAVLPGAATGGLAAGTLGAAGVPLTPLVAVPVGASAAAAVGIAAAAGGGGTAATGAVVGGHTLAAGASAAAGAGGGLPPVAAAGAAAVHAATSAAASAGRQLMKHQTPWAVLQEILAESGPAGLYRGLGAATLRLVPAAMVSFGTYELMRQQILQWEAAAAAATARQQCQQLRSALQVKHCMGMAAGSEAAAAAAGGCGGGECGNASSSSLCAGMLTAADSQQQQQQQLAACCAAADCSPTAQSTVPPVGSSSAATAADPVKACCVSCTTAASSCSSAVVGTPPTPVAATGPAAVVAPPAGTGSPAVAAAAAAVLACSTPRSPR